MFNLEPHPSTPIRRTKTSNNFQLGPDRYLPPSLTGSQKEYLVELTSDNDPANAQSWSFARKMQSSFVLSFDTLVASWGSSVFSAAVESVASEFGISRTVALLGLTLYICGFATGPLCENPGVCCTLFQCLSSFGHGVATFDIL
jgi:DHA1 family multidrug resistance protein-like MFS transporter